VKIAGLLLAIATPAMAVAQAPVEAPAAAPDPARVAAARALVDVMMPPATREQMLRDMMAPMLANLRRGISQNPQFVAALDSDPRLRALFDGFMAKQEQRTTAMMQDSLPGMLPAMANAYARRFDLAQLKEIRAFFETPTGRAYMQGSVTIMSDPDVAAWQRQLMSQAMAHVQEDVAEFTRQVAALAPRKP
jgi:hypothetical protein